MISGIDLTVRKHRRKKRQTLISGTCKYRQLKYLVNFLKKYRPNHIPEERSELQIFSTCFRFKDAITNHCFHNFS